MQLSSLNPLQQRILDYAADFQLSDVGIQAGGRTPIGEILLKFPIPREHEIRQAVEVLAKAGCFKVSGVPPSEDLHLTPTGLLLARGTSEIAAIADALLNYIKRRLEIEGFRFKTYSWADLRDAGVAASDDEFPLIIELIQALNLFAGGSWGKKTGNFNVPHDIIEFRKFHDCRDLYMRVEAQRSQSGMPLSSLQSLVIDRLDSLDRPQRDVKIMTTSTDKARRVFVVHGRNAAAREALFAFLRSIDLHPLEWEEVLALTGVASPYIGQILEAAFSHAQAVVVLLTGDDEARLKLEFRGEHEPEHETQLMPQARPNVLFEAGIALGRSPDRTILVEIGALRPFSDIAGRHVIRLQRGNAGERQALVERLRNARCAVKTEGRRDWLDTDFFARLFAQKT